MPRSIPSSGLAWNDPATALLPALTIVVAAALAVAGAALVAAWAAVSIARVVFKRPESDALTDDQR